MELRNTLKIFFGKPERERSLGRPRRRREDNIKTDLMETEWEGVNWILCLRMGTGGELL
jgi:hypothetical protein